MPSKPPVSRALSGLCREPLRLIGVAACLLLAVATIATAQVGSLYFREAEKDGRIYVFNTSERFAAWQRSGEMGTPITLVGRGAHGETLVGENEVAIDLYLFRHNLPGYDRPTPPPAAPAPPSYPIVRVGTNMFLSYQNGTSAGVDYSKFVVKRAYLDVNGKLTSFLSFRLTPDVTQDSTGDYKLRLKFAYAYLSTASLGFVTRPYLELGMVHTPWLDFEEKINSYRMQDTPFLERSGVQTSADLGFMVGGLLGPELSADAQKRSSSNNPGRWGSFAVGVYNGGGYSAAEVNTNKVIEGRISIRPLPELLPNLQVSYYGVNGKGNTVAAPDWTTSLGALTWECRHANSVVSYLSGKGNARGDAVDPSSGKPVDRNGWSYFVEGKLTPFWSAIGRYDTYSVESPSSRTRFARTLGGICYHIAKGYDVLLDLDRLEYVDTAKPDDTRTQLTLQIKL